MVGEAPEATEGATDGALSADPATKLAGLPTDSTAAQISVLMVKTSGMEG